MGKKVILIVADSLGVGAMPDAAEYGDAGADTFGHIWQHCGRIDMPNLLRIGWGNMPEVSFHDLAIYDPEANVGKCAEASKGKDTTTGHWEIAGLPTDVPFKTYPNGFPQDFMEAYQKAIGMECLGNYPASGTEIIEVLGDEHEATGKPIVYTSADSVFQDYQKRGDYIEKLREALGEYKGNMIDRAELEKKLPKIGWGPEVCGAAWCEEDGVVDPLSLLRAFRAALPRVGVDYRQTLVFDVQPHAGGYRVTTKDGTFDCQKLVLAAGLSNRRFVQFAMPTLPVYADKGQVLLVERMPFVMPIPVLGVTQTFGGTTIIGFRHEKAGHHTQVVPSAVASEGKWAIRVWPELGKKRLIRAWAGLRVMPDDSMAIYSRLPGHPNVTLVNTHSAVTMAAAHTRLLPDFILGGELPETAQGMTLKRFGYSC